MLLTFFYHTVSDRPLPHCKHLFPVKTIREFTRDLEFLLKHYEPAAPDELLDKKPSEKPRFLLTFDDGMREVGEIIAPILLKKGIPAIFFVCRDFARQEAVFYKHLVSFLLEKNVERQRFSTEILNKIKNAKISDLPFLKKTAEAESIDINQLKINDLYLSEKEITDLSEQGFLIGSHSLDHPHFGDISEAEGLRQVTESIEWVNRTFKPPISTFAFPFEDYFLKKTFFEKLSRMPDAPQITFGTSEGKYDPIPNSIQRIDAEKNGWPIEKIIKTYHRKRLLRKLFLKNNINR